MAKAFQPRRGGRRPKGDGDLLRPSETFTLAGVIYFKVSVRTDGGDPSVLIHIRERIGFYVHTKSGSW